VSFIVTVTAATSSLVLGAPAEEMPSQTRNKVWQKLHELEIANQILAIMLTKEQAIALLPICKKAQERIDEIEKKESEQLNNLEAEIAKSLEEVHQKQKGPSQEFLQKISDIFADMRKKRTFIERQNFQEVIQALQKILEPWQVTAMSNSLKKVPREKLTGSVNIEGLNQFIRGVLLDSYAPKIIELFAK
jgi:hypothetical protein